MKLKIRLYYKLFLIVLLFIAGIIIAGVIYPAISFVQKPVSAKQRRDRLKVVWLVWFSRVLRLHIFLEGKPVHAPALFVCNHVSWLDIIAIGCIMPPYFVAKSDISDWPVIGFLAKQGGTIFVERGDKQQVKATAEKMLWQLKQNSPVIAFPEGTTSKGDDVLPFHASLFQPALLTRLPVQPVALQYLGKAYELAPFIGDDSFVPHLLKMLELDKIEVRLTFLEAINSSGKDRQSISHESRSAILKKLTGVNQKTSVQ